jgi:hypothetical protein
MIFDRIRTRDLYKTVDYKVFNWEYYELCQKYITPERIVEAAKALPSDTVDGDLSQSGGVTVDSLSANHVIVTLTPMHYGMKEKNPLDFVKFYSKHKPNSKLHPAYLSLISLSCRMRKGQPR